MPVALRQRRAAKPLWRALGVILPAIILWAGSALAGSDHQLWTELGVRYKVDKILQLRFDQHLRLEHDGTRVESIMPEPALRLRLGKHVRLTTGYRYIYERTGSGDFRTGHRLHLDVQLRLKVAKKTRLDYRLRLQETMVSGELRYGLRNRLRLRLAHWDVFKPFVSTELFQRYEDADRFGTSKFRLTVGGSVELGDHELDLFYRFELPLKDARDPDLHIMGVGVHFDLPTLDSDDDEPFDPKDEESLANNAILVNPLAFFFGLGIGAVPMMDAVGANLKYHRALGDWVGLGLSASFGYQGALFDTYALGLKLGPRVFLAGTRLQGWYLYPIGLVGYTWLQSRAGDTLVSALILGGGIEGGYAWRFRGFVLEVGGGALYAGYVGVPGASGPQKNAKPKNVIPVKPLLNLSIGYCW